MKVLGSATDLSHALDSSRALGRSIGLVPTMGALHSGHRSLIDRAASECDVVVVTIFVNPTQFGDPHDIETYPRDLAADLAICAESGVDVVFAPPVAAMYPDWPSISTSVSVGIEASQWEGRSRPGHFQGVATVVAKLFAMAGRCRAYFGEKDFQQLVVVRRMTRDLAFPVEVIGCPTLREESGLAMSSRNRLLTEQERGAASVLARALAAGHAAASAGAPEPRDVVSVMTDVVAEEPLVELDYAAIVHEDDLKVPNRVDGTRPLRLLIAARVGSVRLIDNSAVFVDAHDGERRSERRHRSQDPRGVGSRHSWPSPRPRENA